jgi:signal transduction histidine kinase
LLTGQYLHWVSDKLGIPVSRHPTADWRETLAAAQAGQCDLLPAVMRTEARAAYLDFTRPYLDLPLVVATAGADPLYIDDLHQLDGKPIGVVAGYATHDLLKQAYPHAKLVAVRDLDRGLRQVSNRQLSALVDLLPTIGYALLAQGSMAVKITGTLPQQMAFSMAVRKGDTRLLAMLQRALDSLPASQRVLLSKRWLKVRSEQTTDYGLLVQSALAMALLLVVLWSWQRHRLRRLDQARAKAEREAHTRREYLAHVSHELRTPINAILGLSQLLGTSALNPQQRQWNERLQVTVDHLLETFNAVLEYSLTDAHVLQLDPQPFQLGELRTRIEAQFCDKAASRGLALRMACAADPESWLEGDVVRLLQVIGNLVDNALKFTTQGRVTLTLEPVGDQLRMVVEDTGIGIPAAQQEAIFQPFVQIKAGNRTPRAGNGLGLAITRQLVAAMGGTLMLTSAPGQGSRFECRVPNRYPRYAPY